MGATNPLDMSANPEIVWSARAYYIHLLSLTGVDKHFLIISSPAKKQKRKLSVQKS